MAAEETVYRARWVFPIDQPPIHNGCVRVVNGSVVELGTSFSGHQKVDLGDIALLPKLVNAHTHLEFSDCRDVVGSPGVPLATWIGQVIAVRGQVDSDQRNRNVQVGLKESYAAGVGLVGDIATTPTAYSHPSDKSRSWPQVVSFAEVLGLSTQRASERLSSAEAHAGSMENDSNMFGVSPHAPYSTPLSLVDSAVDLARLNNAPVAMHLAESPDERALLSRGEGPFADSLRAAGFWQDGVFPYESREPVLDLIGRLSAAPRGLLIHGNDLREREIQVIANHEHLSVVYCPRTHDFFGHEPHPVDQLLRAGVRVALGTDSRASNPDLSLWREMQFLMNHRQDLSPEAILRMGTAAGADALLGKQAGSSNPSGRIVAHTGGAETLISVKTTGKTLEEVYRDFSEQHCQCIAWPQRA